MTKKKVIIIILCCVLVAVSVLGFFVYNKLNKVHDDTIEIIDKPTTTEFIDVFDTVDDLESLERVEVGIYKEEQKADDIINILLIGLDARSYDVKSRSDSMMLVSYNKTKHSMKLVSIMRDIYTYIPEYGWNRINAATVLGGVGLLINTLNTDFDLDIQNYIQIKFEDFKAVIDLLGGLDVELTNSEIRYINNKLHADDNDYSNDITEPAGVIHLNGAQTLWHCRNRTIGNADFERTERQREVLSLLIEKGLKMSVPQATQLVLSISDYVNTNVPNDLIIELVKDALIDRKIDIESYRIPLEDGFSYANKRGMSVLTINVEDTAIKLHEILGYDVNNVEVNIPKERIVVEEKPKDTEIEVSGDTNEENIENLEDVENIEDTENTDNVENTDKIENIDEIVDTENSDIKESLNDLNESDIANALNGLSEEDIKSALDGVSKEDIEEALKNIDGLENLNVDDIENALKDFTGSENIDGLNSEDVLGMLENFY